MRKWLILMVLVSQVVHSATWEGPYYEYCDPNFGPTCDEVIYRSLDVDNFLVPIYQITETDIPQSGWWWNPDQPGEGIFFEISESTNSPTGYYIFGVVYSYTTAGDPEWYTFGGNYQYPADATRWRERGDLFDIRFVPEQAPADFVMGEFHGDLYRANGGAWLTGGQYRTNSNHVLQNFDITFNTPYKATVRTGNRTWEVTPGEVFDGLENSQGAFLTQGVWQVDWLDFHYSFHFPREDGSHNYRPTQRYTHRSQVVRFEEVDMAAEFNAYTGGSALDAPAQYHTYWHPGVRCYASGAFDALTYTNLTDVATPETDWRQRFSSYGALTVGGAWSFLLGCWYPEDDSLRFFRFFWPTNHQDGEDPTISIDPPVGFVTAAPHGEVQTFNAYVGENARWHFLNRGPLVHRFTGLTPPKLYSTHEMLNRMGIHFARLDDGQAAAIVRPGVAHSTSTSPGVYSESQYRYFRKWRLRSWRFDDYPGADFEYPIEHGFYSVLPKAEQTPPRSSAGWWWDPDHPGWGVSYQIWKRSDGSDFMFGAVYAYDEAGNPRWFTFSAEINGTETVQTEAVNFRDGRPLNYNGWRQNRPWQSVPLTIEWQSPTRAVFRINGHDWPIRRADFYRGTGDGTADWLLENAWQLNGVRMEATTNTYYAWKYGENRWEQKPWLHSEMPVRVRPQAVVTHTTTGWMKFNLNDLLMRDRNAIKAVSGASDQALYYLSTRAYDEKFFNYMHESEYTPEVETNPHKITRFFGHSQADKNWFDEVVDAGRFLLVYEPADGKTTLLHVAGATIMDYPAGPLDDVKVLDETVLFSTYLGSSVDEQYVFTDTPCAQCGTDADKMAVAAQWADHNALTMHKIRTMDQNLLNSFDYINPCQFGRWRADGLWPADDDPGRLMEGVKFVEPHYNTVCEYLFGSQWYGPDWRNTLLKFPDLGQQKPYEPHYHE